MILTSLICLLVGSILNHPDVLAWCFIVTFQNFYNCHQVLKFILDNSTWYIFRHITTIKFYSKSLKGMFLGSQSPPGCHSPCCLLLYQRKLLQRRWKLLIAVMSYSRFVHTNILDLYLVLNLSLMEFNWKYCFF